MFQLKNKVQLIGHLGKDPEVKELSNGNKVARLSIATNESYKNNNGDRVESTQWHRLVAWGKTAELAGQLLKKGREVAIEGRLTSHSYETDKGEKRFVTEVVVNEFLLLDKKEA